MKLHLLSISIGTCLLAASSCVSATTPDKEGWYVGGGIGYAHSKMGNTNFPSSNVQKNTDIGIKLYSGYQFDNIWAVEFEYIDFGKLSNTLPGGHINLSSSGFGLSGVANLPLSTTFTVFGKLGVLSKSIKTDLYAVRTNERANETATSIAPILGIGTEYHFTPNISMRAEYEYFAQSKIGDSDINTSNNLLSVSMRYNF